MTMNHSPISYPEHHAVWLDAMGISRWHTTSVILETTPALAQNSGSAVGEPVTATQSPLPEAIANAQYWVIGSAPLEHDSAYLLAGMMAAIQATENDVVYSHIAESHSSTFATGLPHFAKINVQTIEHTSFDMPTPLKVLILGDTSVSFTADAIWQIPSLSALLDTPLLKREAWATLKAMRAKDL